MCNTCITIYSVHVSGLHLSGAGTVVENIEIKAALNVMLSPPEIGL